RRNDVPECEQIAFLGSTCESPIEFSRPTYAFAEGIKGKYYYQMAHSCMRAFSMATDAWAAKQVISFRASSVKFLVPPVSSRITPNSRLSWPASGTHMAEPTRKAAMDGSNSLDRASVMRKDSSEFTHFVTIAGIE